MRLNLVRTYTVAAVLTLSLGAPVMAKGSPDPTGSTTAIVDISKVHVANFGKVNSTYYRGSQPEGQDYADLAALGVKTVINLTSDDAEANEQAMTENAGMTYVQIPMTTHEPPTA